VTNKLFVTWEQTTTASSDPTLAIRTS